MQEALHTLTSPAYQRELNNLNKHRISIYGVCVQKYINTIQKYI